MPKLRSLESVANWHQLIQNIRDMVLGKPPASKEPTPHVNSVVSDLKIKKTMELMAEMSKTHLVTSPPQGPPTGSPLASKFVSPSVYRKRLVSEGEGSGSTLKMDFLNMKDNMGMFEEGGFSRSRNNSGTTNFGDMNDIELAKMEKEVFNHCKLEETDLKACAGKLLSELEKMGITREDPRLTPMMKALKTIKRLSFSANWSGVENLYLDFSQFTAVIKPCIVIVVKVFKGTLVIPEFEEFVKDIQDIYDRCRENTTGKPAGYIPQLARGDPKKWGVSLCTTDGQRYSIGDCTDNFTIQSTSKPFTYALALNYLGADVVQKYIGREPSGRTFNEITLDYNGQPHNPMVNSGAIMSAALLVYMVRPELTISEKFELVHEFFTRMAGGNTVGFQNSVFLSERDTADRNFALAYFMREKGCFPNGAHNEGDDVDIKSILDFYFQTCSLEMNADSMSVMAATLANGGICPITGERVLANEAVKNVLSLMYSCGMYNYSGQFAFQVGLPAKSGVSGIVLVVVPNVVGFALWSPPLDSIGNSARGVMFAEELVKIYNFHTFDSIGDHVTNKKNPKVQNYEEQSLKLVQLLFAACNGDQLALERAYLSGVDMNMGDYDNRTALHLACVENHPACVKYLLVTCKVELDVQDRWGNTPLQEALRFNHSKIVTMLKKHMLKNKQEYGAVVKEEDEGVGSRRSSYTVKDNNDTDQPKITITTTTPTKEAQPPVYCVRRQDAKEQKEEGKEKRSEGSLENGHGEQPKQPDVLDSTTSSKLKLK